MSSIDHASLKSAISTDKKYQFLIMLFLAFSLPMAELSHAGADHKNCEICAHLNVTAGDDDDIQENLEYSLFTIKNLQNFKGDFQPVIALKSDFVTIRGPPYISIF